MTIFQKNRRRGHKFIFSALLFGFCMARITTLVLRIVSITWPRNISTAIAAQILVLAGVLLLFIINLIFAWHIIRAQHPHFGWHRVFSALLIGLYVLVGATLVMTITVTVMTFYTLNPNTKRIARDIQLYAATYLGFVATLPLPIVLIGVVLQKKTRVEKFGSGRFRTKIFVLLSTTTLLAFGAWYHAGTSYINPVPRTQPLPAYYHKAAFYIVNFGVEIMVVWLYVLLRIDRRFITPNGAKCVRSYAAGPTNTLAKEPESTIIHTEEETFDDQSQ
ncbi:hypothetical protein P152DRAFT_446037 [Eremomyces bilateralis CBS 781.70]|uniref:Uncharacterized protein n=1 Tax=Eremomyces bilateralis CBS 781.70 TaxID=1392243 RepID=A0A6G1GE34_9PEZI|nr:uncharacterized protein P152DRAFT_446037 [Eremomyces bilateralis CBS 781.70]KAF1816375.1 hypothetical protein P152DRAFT_446037 [Eremomyces bilateralis CBS 781.70]